MIAFDTDVLTEILLGDPAFVAPVVTVPPREQAVPVVVMEELMRGRLQGIRQAGAVQARVNLPRAYDLFEQTLQDIQQVTVLSYTPQADTLYLQWRHQCIRVGTHDLRIVAICVAYGAALIARNRQDYPRVPGLQVEFWQ